jgi:hypothetical protein
MALAAYMGALARLQVIETVRECVEQRVVSPDPSDYRESGSAIVNGDAERGSFPLFALGEAQGSGLPWLESRL